MRYINPVIVLDEPDAPVKKARLVEIYKNNVYKDIDLHTYKHVDGSDAQNKQVRNAVASDVTEDMDGAVIARLVEFRDAQLRRLLQGFLDPTEVEYADDEITLEDNRYRYNLLLPESFNDNVLRSLAEFMHRFLVWGALYDWYLQFGMQQATLYGQQLDEIEKAIKSLLRGKSIVKRPLQPFGPAHKINW